MTGLPILVAFAIQSAKGVKNVSSPIATTARKKERGTWVPRVCPLYTVQPTQQSKLSLNAFPDPP